MQQQKHGPRLACSACKITAHTSCISILLDKIKFICKHTFKDLTISNPRHIREVSFASAAAAATAKQNKSSSNSISSNSESKTLAGDQIMTTSPLSAHFGSSANEKQLQQQNVIYHHWVHKRTHCGRCKQCTKTFGNTKLPGFSSKVSVC